MSKLIEVIRSAALEFGALAMATIVVSCAASPFGRPTPTPTACAGQTGQIAPPGGLSRNQALATVSALHLSTDGRLTVLCSDTGRLSGFDHGLANTPNADEWVWYVELSGTFDMSGSAPFTTAGTPPPGPPPVHHMAVMLDYYSGRVVRTIRAPDNAWPH